MIIRSEMSRNKLINWPKRSSLWKKTKIRWSLIPNWSSIWLGKLFQSNFLHLKNLGRPRWLIHLVHKIPSIYWVNVLSKSVLTRQIQWKRWKSLKLPMMKFWVNLKPNLIKKLITIYKWLQLASKTILNFK